MKTYTINASITIKEDIDTVFDFFDRPENLEEMTPPLLSFSTLTPAPIEMKHGTCIDYVVKVLGIPTRWTSMIQNYQKPEGFVDIQLKGPYSFWHHHHGFSSPKKGETIVTDSIHYAVPFGLLGRLVHFIYIKPQLKYIFSFRHRFLKTRYAEKTSDATLNFS